MVDKWPLSHGPRALLSGCLSPSIAGLRVGASKQINIAEQTAAIKVCPVFMCFVLVDYRRSLDAVMQERKMMTLAVTMGTFGLLGCLSSAR